MFFRSIHFILCAFFFLSAFYGASQKVVPNEYIIKWKNSRAAEKFYQGVVKRRSAPSFYTSSLMPDPLCLDHIVFSGPDHHAELEELKKHPDVLYVGANHFLEERSVPDDPLFPQQWQYINNGIGGLENADLDMDLAWDITTGGLTTQGDTIVICVIDEGVNLNHPDLVENLWINHAEIPLNGIDDDNNGYIDDFRGWNVESGTDDLSQGGSHGTPVCGITGARGNNGLGVSGVNWNVKIMFVKYGSGTEANAIASYAYAYNQRKRYNQSNGTQGAFVVVTNASWGLNDVFASEAPLWCEMFDLLGEEGILHCGATTNRDVDVDKVGDMPTTCESPYLVSVTNMTRSDQKLNGAGYGRKSIDLGAYGHQTYTLSTSQYAAFGGTSGATPHVAGSIALMYSTPCNVLIEQAKSDPANAARIVRDMLLFGVVQNSSLSSITTTGGRLNSHRALLNIQSLCTSCSPPAGLYIETEGSDALVFWADVIQNGVVGLRYRKLNDTEWIYKQNIHNGDIISGLEFCQEYELQLSSSCGLLPDEFSYSLFFTSGGCCPKPDNFVQEYNNGNLIFSWDFPEITSFSHEISLIDIDGNILEFTQDSNLLILENLPECSWYSFSVASFCKQYQTNSDIVEGIIINSACGSCTALDYCEFSSKNTRDEWIQKVEFGELTNESGVNPQGYGNYLGAKLTSFQPDSAYDLFILPGFSSSPFTEQYLVYIDFNNDGIFSQDELVFDARTSSTEGVRSNVIIPSDATEGITRMRVILAFQSHNSPCDDNDFEYGEIEDYCIKISRGKEECVLDNNILIDSLNDNTIRVEFTPLENVEKYYVFYKKIDGTEYDTLIVSGSPCFVSGLDSCQQYILRIAAECESGMLSFTSENSFLSPCRTSVKNVFAKETIRIFPNPFTNEIRIVSSPFLQIKSIHLTDIFGQPLSENDFHFSENNNHIYFWNVPAGCYILQLVSNRGTFNNKIIKI
jgi:serine protease